MSEPTDSQAYAWVTKPEFLVEWKPGVSWEQMGTQDDILDVSGALSVDTGNGVAFGGFASADFRVDTLDTPAIADEDPDFVPVRVSVGYDGSAKMPMCAGVITNRKRSLGSASLSFTVEGYHTVLARQPVYSDLYYRRPAFTPTTALSVEDPDDPSWQGGLGNYILYVNGGRPLEQPATHSEATFLYSCSASLITIPWTWAAGGNAWEELLRLARAVGGQLYQAPDGTLTYRNPLDFAEPTGAPFNLNGDVYADLTEDRPLTELVSVVECPYLPRSLLPFQEVYKDDEPKRLQASETKEFTIVPQWPLYSHDALEVLAVDATGTKYTLTANVTDDKAQRIVFELTNPVARPIVVTRVRLQGEPVAAGEERIVEYDTGIGANLTTKLTVDSNPYIQEEDGALRLCRMLGDFYGLPRYTRDAPGCPFDPRRSLGEYVTVTEDAWGLDTAPHRITAIRHSAAGAVADYGVVDVTGLPVASDMFLIGETYSSGDSMEVGY